MPQEKPQENGNHDPEKDEEQRQPGAGITNRPDEVERENQERVPPRGETKNY